MKLVTQHKSTPGVRVFNKAEVAEAFGVTLPTIDAWIRKGCPVMQRGRRGVAWELDIFEAYKWRFDVGAADADSEDPEQMSPKERLDYYKGCRERDAHRKESGELMHVDDVTATWTKIVGITKSRLMALPMRLAPVLVAVTELREAEDTVQDGIVAALEDLSAVSSDAVLAEGEK